MALSFSVLRIRDFRLLLFTRACGTMALQAQALIVGWQIYSLTHSTFMLGLTGLAEAVPALSCALFAGHVVDVWRPYRVFVGCIMALTLNMLLLFLLGGGMVAPPGGNVVPWIFAGVFFSGLARSFMIPSSFTLQLEIVPRPLIPAATAWRSGVFQLGIVAGPAIAGVVYGGYGARIAWLLPVSLIAIELVLALSVSKKHRQLRSSEKHESALKSMHSGWRFIRHHDILFAVMALDMFAVLFGGAVAMLPAYADRILHVGSEGLGALRAAPALGAIVATLTLALRPMKHISGRLLLWVIAGFGGCMITFGISTSFALSMLFLAISGAFDSISVVIRSMLVQLLTPPAMRGRVSSVNSMFIISSNEIGSFESGVAASLLGLVPSVVFGGIGTLVVVAVTALKVPKLLKLQMDTQKTD